MKEIPFFDYVVTKANYNDVKDFENTNLEIKRQDDGIRIRFKHTYPSNIFYYKNIYSLNEETLAEYLCKSGITITENADYTSWVTRKYTDKKHWSVSQLMYNKYNEIDKVSKLWEYAVVHPDLTIDIKYYDEITIKTIPKQNIKPIISQWIRKYENIFSNLDGNDLIWELSAGFDSRILTHFYKKPTLVYSNNSFEYAIAAGICKTIGADIVNEKRDDKITITGIGNFKTFSVSLMENYIGIHYYKHLVKNICPFLDRDYLQMDCNPKKALNILLCPELTSVPYFSFCDRYVPFDAKEQDFVKEEFKCLFE